MSELELKLQPNINGDQRRSNSKARDPEIQNQRRKNIKTIDAVLSKPETRKYQN